MLTLTARLLRFLLTLVVRLHLPARRIALAFQARFASLWRSFLTCPRRRDQAHIRLLASEGPSREGLRISERAQVPEEEADGTLAALPVQRNVDWQNNVTRYQDSSHRIEFDEDPATPETGSQRYKPKQLNRDSDPPDIPAGQKTLLSSLPPLPSGWRRNIHPEGNVFYYHKELRIFTESDIFEREGEILYCASVLIQKAINTADVILDDLTEIFLNVDDSGKCHYYFVDNKNRLLFWLQPVKSRLLGTGLQGFTEYSHIRYLVETQYWYASSGSISDMMTTDSSTSPFAQDELVAILDLVNSLKDDEKISDPYSIWATARIMAFFTENQFLNFSGQSCARLNADTTLFESPDWNRRTVFKTVNVFLFGSPSEHAVRLKRVWVDGIIIQPRWKEFVNRLTSELTRYTLFSTVMLAVNFSFLAVPGVVTIGSPASSIQIIIYCSIVSTVASIVFSFALLNVYNDPEIMVAGPAAKVMHILSERRVGMACLAITHSLPIASLIWAITLFSTALAVQIFGPKERSTVTTLGVECLVLVLLAAMGIVVMQLFYKNDGVVDEETPEENTSTPTRSQDDDIEMGSQN